MAIIILVRHGETDWVGKRLQGRLPGINLNETGRRQAQLAAEALQHLPIKAIYSSPLERAAQTAQYLADRKGLQVEHHPGLIEMDYGSFTGKTFKQLWKMKGWKQMVQPGNTEPFPGGDSVATALERVITGIEDIAGRWGEKDIVACFTHADQVRLTIAHYLHMPEGEFHRLVAHTAAATVIQVFEGQGQVIQVNQVLSQPGWVEFVEGLAKQSEAPHGFKNIRKGKKVGSR
ncbi:MAG: histidine phosphatase family protein [bacterium]